MHTLSTGNTKLPNQAFLDLKRTGDAFNKNWADTVLRRNNFNKKVCNWLLTESDLSAETPAIAHWLSCPISSIVLRASLWNKMMVMRCIYKQRENSMELVHSPDHEKLLCHTTQKAVNMNSSTVIDNANLSGKMLTLAPVQPFPKCCCR